jgi:hypothetical protein
VRFALVFVILAVAACEPPGYGKHHDVDAGSGSGDGSVVTTDGGPDGPMATTCNHSFRLDGHGTDSSVWLTGDFNMWAGDPSHGAVAFTLGVDGAWTGSYAFSAGMHVYKFIIDGTQWIPDPTNTNTVPDGFGGVNSVYDCMP